jgi:hypothetical protein
MKVYKRTSEGQWAAFDEHSPLPRKLKILLKAVNGKVAEDVYVKSLGSFGDVLGLLLSLEQAGLIADKRRDGDKSGSGARAKAAPAAMDITTDTERTVVVPQPDGSRRPSAVQWQALPELTELSVPDPALAAKTPVAVKAQSPLATLPLAPASVVGRPAAPAPVRAPPVLTEVHALSDPGKLAELDALANLAELAGQSAPAIHAARASNILTHDALMAANAEPSSGANSQRNAVRHAVELMSNFVLNHMPRTASQVLPEIESLHSVEQWEELMAGYASFVLPTGELGQLHLVQIRRLLENAMNASGVGGKGWYA